MISAMDKFRADTHYSLYENASISLEISLIDWLIDLYSSDYSREYNQYNHT